MMTERDAKTKWCPMAREMAMASFNRPFTPYHTAAETCCCIGSACMAWRWGRETFPKFHVAMDDEGAPMVPGCNEPARPANVPGSWEWSPGVEDDGDDASPPGWCEPRAESNARRKGYCGAFPSPMVRP